jgi:hypothetical protein
MWVTNRTEDEARRASSQKLIRPGWYPARIREAVGALDRYEAGEVDFAGRFEDTRGVAIDGTEATPRSHRHNPASNRGPADREAGGGQLAGVAANDPPDDCQWPASDRANWAGGSHPDKPLKWFNAIDKDTSLVITYDN